MVSAKQPPRDQDAEEAVIGSLLIDGAAIYKVADFLKETDFFYEQNQALYGACTMLFGRDEAINQVTVAQELARQGKLEQVGGAAQLSHLISVCPTSMDIEHYGRIVYRLSIDRQLVNVADQIAAIGYEAGPDVEQSLGRAEAALFKLRRGQGAHDLTHIRDVLDKYLEPPAERGEEGEKSPFVLSGFAGLDEVLGGFQRSDLIIVGGRPSMGKTSLALNIARNAAVEHAACVAIFSLEMARDSIVQRFLSSEAGIDTQTVRKHYSWEKEEAVHGNNWDTDESKIMNATGVLSEAAIYIDDTPMLRMGEMRAKALRLHAERGIDMVIVDYLQLMASDRRIENRVQEVSEISRALKGLARELNAPVLAVSQLSRAAEGRTSHEPLLSDLRESGSIEQDADVVLLVYREEYYYKESEWGALHPEIEYPRGIADVFIAKHRNGPTGRVPMRFKNFLAKFENIASEEPRLM